jgi:hypothetical protein
MTAKPDPSTTQAHVADAIAHVREAMQLAEHREISHFLNDEEPCAAANAAEDAAVRSALLSSEDAMIQVLEALPPSTGVLVN